jgi:Zn-dependent peptidase ImmA (M78 family)
MKANAPQLDRFADTFCLDRIEKAVSSFVAENYDKLEYHSRIQAEGARLDDIQIEFTTNVKTYGKQIGFDAVVSTDIEIYETVRGEDRSDAITQWFRVPCQVIFEEKVEGFRIHNGKTGDCIEIYSKSERGRTPLAATNDLVPVIYGENYDAEATRFLKKYCPEVLKTPMPIPLDKIAEAMGIPPINYDKHLSPDFSVFGKICFANEEIDVYDTWGVPEKIQAKRGQIFIDNDTYLMCNVGCLRNTIAHELFHWERHRLYATIRRLLDTPEFKSTSCRTRPQGSTKRKNEELTDEEWIELHANNISPRIIMPSETVKPKAKEILKKYGYSLQNADEKALRTAIAELSDFFQVSKQLATVRLAQLGITQAQDIFDADYDKNILCASQIPPTDILKEYTSNASFCKAIESGLFRYAEGRFVINDPKYINKADGGIYILTEYAREHLGECALNFETVETEAGDYRGDGLYRKNKAGFALLKKYVEDRATLDTAEARAKTSEALKELAAQDRKYLTAVGSGAYFSESFNALMKAYFEPLGVPEHKYGAEVLTATGIADNKYRDMRNGDAGYCPTHRRITALCAGFDFDVSIAEALLHKGGRSYTTSDEHAAFRLMLTAYRGYGIFERSDYLQSMGHGRLDDDK